MRGFESLLYQNTRRRIHFNQYQHNISICNYLVALIAIFLEERIDKIYNRTSIRGNVIKIFECSNNDNKFCTIFPREE